MLLYSVPQQHCRRGCGGSALPAQKLSGEKMQDHMEVRPWRPHGMFFISQERRNISRDENLHVLFFFPPVWPIRTRLGPYNCVSSEKQKCTRTRVVQKLWQIITKPKTNKTTTKPPQPKTTRKSPSQICVSPQIKTAKQQRTGQGPTKQKTHSDLP